MENIPSLDDLLTLDELEGLTTPPIQATEEPPVTPVVEEPETVEASEDPIEVQSTPLDSSESSSSALEFLKSQGLLIVPEDFDFDSETSLEEAAQLTRQSYREEALDAVWEAIPPSFKPVFEYALSGGSDLNEYLEKFAPAYDSLSAETPENQRKVMELYYKATSKYSDDRINRMINRLEDAEQLEEAALESLEELKTLQTEKLQALSTQAEAAREQQRKEQEKIVAQMNSAISKIDDVAQKTKVKGLFFNEIQAEDGSRLSEFDSYIRAIRSNPEHIVQLGRLLLDTYNSKSGFNFDKFVKQGKSQAVTSIKTILDQKFDSKSKVKNASSESKKGEVVNLEKFFDY